jgi:hypothetical protein
VAHEMVAAFYPDDDESGPFQRFEDFTSRHHWEAGHRIAKLR